MGQQVSSRNYIDNLAETITRIIQENSQACQVSSTQVQQLAFSGNCSNITIKNVDFNQLSGVDFNCMQSAELNAKVASEMQVQLEQQAKSLLDGLNFNIASQVEAQNFITNHIRLVTEIMNRINQNCTVNAGQYQGISCTDQAHDILVDNVSFNQLIKSVFNCAQEGELVADVQTDIKEFIKQAAIAENKGLSFGILWIILILAVIGVVIFLLNKVTDPKFLLIVVPILFIVYLVLANRFNWWPFKSKFDDKNRKPPPPIPPPPKPASVVAYEAKQAKLKYDQAMGRARLALKKSSITPEQYRQLKYGDAQIAFDNPLGRPFQQGRCKGDVAPVRLNMKRREAIIV